MTVEKSWKYVILENNHSQPTGVSKTKIWKGNYEPNVEFRWREEDSLILNPRGCMQIF